MVIPNEAAQPLCFSLALLHPEKLGLTPSSDPSRLLPSLPRATRSTWMSGSAPTDPKGGQPRAEQRLAASHADPGSSRELHELMAGAAPARPRREGTDREGKAAPGKGGLERGKKEGKKKREKRKKRNACVFK